MRTEQEIQEQLDCITDAYQKYREELGYEDFENPLYVSLMITKGILEWVCGK